MKAVVFPTETQKPLDNYRARYIAVWGVGWLLLLGGVTALVLGIFFATPHENVAHGITDPATNSTRNQYLVQAAIAFPVMALCFLLFSLMYRGSARLRYRAGSGFFGGLFGEWSSFAPRTMEELEAACESARKSCDRLSAVGSGWSNTLGQRTTRGRRLYMHRATGRVDKRTWLAGTTLKQVQRELASETPPMQLIGVPSSSYVTLGAWVATLGHGNSGPAAAHDLVVASAKVFDQATGLVLEMNASKLLDAFGKGANLASQYVVLSVTLEDGIFPDEPVKRQGRRLVTEVDANWFLDKRSLMRAVFIGNTKALALRWIPHNGDAIAESIVLKVWLFIFAALGWGSAMPNYEGNDSTGKLSDEVYLFPDSFNPPQLWTQMILNIVNYELYTKDIVLDAPTLLVVSERLQRLHTEHGGRTELRKLGDIVFFDMAMWAGRDAFRASFKALHDLGIKKCAQHPGKYWHTVATAACGGVDLVDVKNI